MVSRLWRYLLSLLSGLINFAFPRPKRGEPFAIKPYLQLGESAKRGNSETYKLIWHSEYQLSDWQVEQSGNDGKSWSSAVVLPESRRVKLPYVGEVWQHQALLTGLSPGRAFHYRFSFDGKLVFTAGSQALKTAAQSFRTIVVGDVGDGSNDSKAVAAQMFLQHPELMVIAGDIVYERGRIEEYIERFFPVYNNDLAHSSAGAPILRSILCVGAAGNHDMGIPSRENVSDPAIWKDLGGFFEFWSQPGNGPGPDWGSRNAANRIDEPAIFRRGKEEFYRVTNFSFDNGNAHWLILDGNMYMDWSDSALRQWVEKDLSAASESTWKFVVFHQPPFTCDLKYINEQRMRLLCQIFERHGVDVVFSGHCHLYERTFPLRYVVHPREDGKPLSPEGKVDGRYTLDQKWDGSAAMSPEGVIYITTGSGGKHLGKDHIVEHFNLPAWTAKLVDDRRSFTLLQGEGTRLLLQQLGVNGEVLDSFVLDKSKARQAAGDDGSPASSQGGAGGSSITGPG